MRFLVEVKELVSNRTVNKSTCRANSRLQIFGHYFKSKNENLKYRACCNASQPCYPRQQQQITTMTTKKQVLRLNADNV